jgi:hypothetical protein
MKTVVVRRQEVVDLTCGDVDAQFAQLFEQQRLRHVALVILVHDEGDQFGTEVAAGQDVRRQGRQQRLASRGDDAFAPIPCQLGLQHQFLNVVFFVAIGHGPRRRVRERDRHEERFEGRGLLGMLGGARAFVTGLNRWFKWFFESAGCDGGPRLFALENGNLVAEL